MAMSLLADELGEKKDKEGIVFLSFSSIPLTVV